MRYKSMVAAFAAVACIRLSRGVSALLFDGDLVGIAVGNFGVGVAKAGLPYQDAFHRAVLWQPEHVYSVERNHLGHRGQRLGDLPRGTHHYSDF